MSTSCLGMTQRMPFRQWINIKKSKELIILRHFVARYFTRDNFAEYCCHNFTYIK